jgi:hypothetical protein
VDLLVALAATVAQAATVDPLVALAATVAQAATVALLVALAATVAQAATVALLVAPVATVVQVGTADLLAPVVMVTVQPATVALPVPLVVTAMVLVIAHLRPRQTEKVTLRRLPEKVMSERVALPLLPPLPEKGITETKEINVHLRCARHPLLQ